MQIKMKHIEPELKEIKEELKKDKQVIKEKINNPRISNQLEKLEEDKLHVREKVVGLNAKISNINVGQPVANDQLVAYSTGCRIGFFYSIGKYKRRCC